jgi:hypothetical protein
LIRFYTAAACGAAVFRGFARKHRPLLSHSAQSSNLKIEAIAWRHIPGDHNLQNSNISKSLSEVPCTDFGGEAQKTGKVKVKFYLCLTN